MSTSMPRLALTFSTASEMTVRFRRPRKSIFSEPMYSQLGPSNPVIRAPSSARRWIGITSTSGSEDKITPAACTPVPRIRPSMPLAVSMTFLTSGSSAYIERSSPASACRSCSSSKIAASGISLPCTAGGNALVIFSPTANG